MIEELARTDSCESLTWGACYVLCQGHNLFVMPRYEHRCRNCGDTFEVSRPIREASEPVACPQGHLDTVKLLSTVSFAGGGSTTGQENPAPAGGCCGGGCGC